ncbi:hypothetical protein EV360DRAFT_78035 [Lentinula raphanica]|nr:hypothetical protein EV360DRAFT_78035 [Lentinula raphanica]
MTSYQQSVSAFEVVLDDPTAHQEDPVSLAMPKSQPSSAIGQSEAIEFPPTSANDSNHPSYLPSSTPSPELKAYTLPSISLDANYVDDSTPTITAINSTDESELGILSSRKETSSSLSLIKSITKRASMKRLRRISSSFHHHKHTRDSSDASFSSSSTSESSISVTASSSSSESTSTQPTDDGSTSSTLTPPGHQRKRLLSLPSFHRRAGRVQHATEQRDGSNLCDDPGQDAYYDGYSIPPSQRSFEVLSRPRRALQDILHPVDSEAHSDNASSDYTSSNLAETTPKDVRPEIALVSEEKTQGSDLSIALECHGPSHTDSDVPGIVGLPSVAIDATEDAKVNELSIQTVDVDVQQDIHPTEALASAQNDITSTPSTSKNPNPPLPPSDEEILPPFLLGPYLLEELAMPILSGNRPFSFFFCRFFWGSLWKEMWYVISRRLQTARLRRRVSLYLTWWLSSWVPQWEVLRRTRASTRAWER